MDTMARWILGAGERTSDTTVSNISTISQTQNTILTGGCISNYVKHELFNCRCRLSLIPIEYGTINHEGNKYRKYFFLYLTLAIIHLNYITIDWFQGDDDT